MTEEHMYIYIIAFLIHGSWQKPVGKSSWRGRSASFLLSLHCSGLVTKKKNESWRSLSFLNLLWCIYFKALKVCGSDMGISPINHKMFHSLSNKCLWTSPRVSYPAPKSWMWAWLLIEPNTLWFWASLMLCFLLSIYDLSFLLLLGASVACGFQGVIRFQIHTRIQGEDEICSAVVENIEKVFGLAGLVPVETNSKSKWNCFIKKSFYELCCWSV